MHLQERVRGSQPPETGHLPFWSDLATFRRSHQAVAKLSRQKDMSRRGIGFDVGSPNNVLAEKAAVMIEEACDIQIQLFMQ